MEPPDKQWSDAGAENSVDYVKRGHGESPGSKRGLSMNSRLWRNTGAETRNKTAPALLKSAFFSSRSGSGRVVNSSSFRTAPSSPARQPRSASVSPSTVVSGRNGRTAAAQISSPRSVPGSCGRGTPSMLHDRDEMERSSESGTAPRSSFERPLTSMVNIGRMNASLSAERSTKRSGPAKGGRSPAEHRKSNRNKGGGRAAEVASLDDVASAASGGGDGNLQDLGPLFLKLASAMHLTGENPHKALECASRAVRFLERSYNTSSSNCDLIEDPAAAAPPCQEKLLVMSLYILAAIHCRMGQWEAALPVLQKALSIPFHASGNVDADTEHAMAAFAGNMQLGDVLSMLGQQSNAIACYRRAYSIQKAALGETDPTVADTCTYIAEAHLQAMQFEEAAELCRRALLIHGEHRQPGSAEEARDRRLMALILSGMGHQELALEQLVLASAALAKQAAAAKEEEAAAVEASIGDVYTALGRQEEARRSYQRATAALRAAHGEGHPKVARLQARMAEQMLKAGKYREAKASCEAALRIYGRRRQNEEEEEEEDVAAGLAEMAAVYESMNERETAVMLLQRALDILDGLPGHQSSVAGIQGQMGVLYYMLAKFPESVAALNDAVLKLRAAGLGRSALVAALVNQMGLACIQLHDYWHAADLFQDAHSIFSAASGPDHSDTLAVSSNLAAVYDALGRSDEAIDLLESILDVKEERLGTVHPEVEDERHRLMQLLKEAGRERSRKTSTLEELLLLNNVGMHKKSLMMMMK